MSHHYRSIAFTEPVLDAQVHYGSRAAIDRSARSDGGARSDGLGGPDPARDPMGSAEREFVAERDGFYLATVSESGWPYVQFRGGPRGFVTAPDEHTLAWPDFRGNRQYISTGNVDQDPRVAMIFMDYAHQVRLKVFGVASIVDVHGPGPYSGALALPGYPAIVEREVRVEVRAFDWNCPQHITPRFSAEELAPVLAPLRRRVDDLETENRLLREQLDQR
jgi:predicted pyridoxine 5'-phosphate oxidase superfamily flavin-nucleotide-binding protein